MASPSNSMRSTICRRVLVVFWFMMIPIRVRMLPPHREKVAKIPLGRNEPMADRALNSDEQVLALATKRAVQAAGGLDVCEREILISDSQLSRCCSANHRDSLTIRDAAVLDSISFGHEGHPFILNALARIVGGHIVVRLPDAHLDEAGLVASTLELATELGDVSRAISEAMCSTSAGGAEVTKAEAVAVLEHVDDLDRASARLRQRLTAISKGEQPSV